jgi:N6-adenosine-specific RNA methylase IME4
MTPIVVDINGRPVVSQLPVYCSPDDLSGLANTLPPTPLIYAHSPYADPVNEMWLDDVTPLIGQLAADTCTLFIWSRLKRLHATNELIAAWGFRHIGPVGAWTVEDTPAMDSDILLLAVKRQPIHLQNIRIGSVHSILADDTGIKPESFRNDIMRSTHRAGLELFAPEASPGWVSWGWSIPKNDFIRSVHYAVGWTR